MVNKMDLFVIYSNSVQFLSSGPVVVMELMGDEAVSVWKNFVREAESALAKEAQGTQVETDGIRTFGYGSDSLSAASKVRKQPSFP